MHETRLNADRLLAEGKIEEADVYHSAGALPWDNGYHIRKLNQAYFAFHGAYADSSGQPGGAAGEDPVAAAVRTLSATRAPAWLSLSTVWPGWHLSKRWNAALLPVR